MSNSMPVKLSGDLVEEARHSAKIFHRSLTGQIEHWAALGRVIESKLPGEALSQFLAATSESIKITDVAEAGQRKKLFAVLTGFLNQTSDGTKHDWIEELSAKGIPLYGTKDAVGARSSGRPTKGKKNGRK